MPESRNRDLATSLGQAVKNNTITSTGSLAVVGLTAYDSAGLLPSSYDSNNAGTLGFAEDSDKLYIHTGQGWFNIAVINTTPIFTTSPSASYTLETDATAYKNGTATVITLAARDSEGFPVTFSATGDTAFNNIAHVDKDSAAGFIFTVEPKSQDSVGEAAPANGTLTFSVTDGINTASATSTFSLLFDTSVANSEGTTMFLGATGNNQGNYTFTDESDSPHTISRVAGASDGQIRYTQVTGTSPFAPAGYSTMLGGAGESTFISEQTDFIKYKNGTHFAFGAPSGNSNDFTIEGWYYSVTTTTNGRYLFDFRGSSESNLAPAINVHDNSGRLVARAGSSAVGITGSTGSLAGIDGVFKDFRWNHVAWVRNASTSKIYLNGCEVLSFTDNNTYVSAGSGGDNYFILGRIYPANTSATNNARFVGYIRDFRVVKGTAVYTANFTPPTAPLQTITNTEFLICNKPYLRGMGAEGAPGKGNFMSATTGPINRAFQVAFSPYKIQQQWSASTVGGSLQHGGRVQVSGHADFQFGTSTDFTIEFWFYDKNPNYDYNGDVPMIDTRTSSGNGYFFYIDHTSSGHIVRVKYGTTSSSTLLISSSHDLDNLGGWSHIALTRSGSTHTLFHNGELITTGSNVDWNSSGNLLIGSDGGTSRMILMGPMRIVKGTAVYSGNFYPPTAPFTKTGSTYKSLKDPGNDNSTTVDNSIAASETVFIANWTPNVGDRAGFTAFNAMGQWTADPVVYDGPVSSTGSQKYSVPSMLWDKTDYEYLETRNNNTDNLMFPNIISDEDFTFESWVQWSGTAETQDGLDPQIVCFRQSSDISNAGYSGLYADVSDSGRLNFKIGSSSSSTGSAVSISGSGANLLDGNWHHIVMARNNGKIYLFVDGIMHSSTLTYSGRIAPGNYTNIGGGTYVISPSFRYTGGWNGNMSQMRLKKGKSIYPFVPKKETLTTSTSFQNGITVTASNTKLLCCHHSTITTDGSSNQTITANGTTAPAVSSFAPIGGMKSAYFVGGTGNTSSLTTGTTADFAFGTGDATIELWAYFTSVADVPFFIDFTNSTDTSYIAAAQYNGKIRVYNFGGSPSYYDGSTTIVADKWYHIALVRKSQVWSLFINGSLDTGLSWNDTQNYGNTTLTIGARQGNVANDYKFKGYLSNYRVVKGQAIYDKDFTPPSEAMYG